MRTHYLPRTFAGVLALAAAGSLAACSGGGDEASGAVTETSPDGIEMTVDRTADLAEGDTVQVDISGLDTSSGYYLALCGVTNPEGQPFPDCTGDRSGETQKWFRNPEGTEQMNDEGTISTTLTITPKGEAIDCRESECAVKLFGDHREAFYDIVQVPVTLK
ncbi:neocarzinostatin apoprotein domain-containing protein [Corynebacterium sp. 335C]